MKNPGIALALNFNTVEFSPEKFQKHWTIFRDTQTSKFLVIFADKRIEELRMMLEKAKPEDVQGLQGQIFEARKIKDFLSQSDITNEVQTVSAYIGLPVK